MKKLLKKNKEIILIVLITLIIFLGPMFSNKPLGLDGIGHLSKVSYIKQFGLVNWDMSWYSGSLFLKMYPPLFYYVNTLFPSKIVPLGANLICFFSLLFTVIGIYLLGEYLTKNKKAAFIASIFFLTTLSISYYWIATGNFPYFSALWTIPFSLYFLEKSIREKSNKDFVFFSLVFSISIITHVVTGFLIGIFMIVRFLFEGLNFKNIKKIFFYGGIPVLLSAFWFFPFLNFSNSSMSHRGYVPNIINLLGFGNCCWGLKAGGIGIAFIMFLIILLFSLRNITKTEKCYLTLCLILSFFLMGGLGKYYPFGVDPVRFILPFAALIMIFFSISLDRLGWLKSKKITTLLFFLMIVGLICNFSIVHQNFRDYNYVEEGSRYLIMKELVNNPKFPISNEINNYRIGTSRYVFGETINYFMPSVSHTFGYQDAGMLNQEEYYKMKESIWDKKEVNESIFWLDWFAIKYFEGTFQELNQFDDDNRFTKVNDFYPNGYTFSLYEYLDAKPIISLVESINDETLGTIKEYSFKRESPDKLEIYYNNFEEGNLIVFKEFYNKNWVAKEISNGEKLSVVEIGPGFMAIYPKENSKGVILQYKKDIVEIFSIVLSIFTIIFLFIIWKK